MALMYWYILPIGMEMEFDYEMLHNFSCLLEIVEFAMTVKARTDCEISEYQGKINTFLHQYELQMFLRMFGGVICVCFNLFTYLCISDGSIRLGSQATVEWTIGEAGHKIHSKKSPFANMANIFFQKELTKALLLYYPDLQKSQPENLKPVVFGKIKIKKQERKEGKALYDQLLAIFESCRQLGEFDPMFPINRWGKCDLNNGTVLNSVLSEDNGEKK